MKVTVQSKEERRREGVRGNKEKGTAKLFTGSPAFPVQIKSSTGKKKKLADFIPS